tara:strand:- start:763 stop:1218 length:456 start_codon:yes stop_codon:yes gene_type:complete
MFSKIKNHFYIFLFLITTSCQFQEPYKNHGIVFLENRSKQINVKTSNKNDVLRIIGQPHTKSIDDDETWIYIERVLTKGEYHKLGRNILKSNNVLVLEFDKFGILKNKLLLNKDDKNKIAFSEAETENKLSQKSFVQSFLQSIKQKMYGNK